MLRITVGLPRVRIWYQIFMTHVPGQPGLEAKLCGLGLTIVSLGLIR